MPKAVSSKNDTEKELDLDYKKKNLKTKQEYDAYFKELNSNYIRYSNQIKDINKKRTELLEVMMAVHEEYQNMNGKDDNDDHEDVVHDDEEEEMVIEKKPKKATKKATKKSTKKKIPEEEEEEEIVVEKKTTATKSKKKPKKKKDE